MTTVRLATFEILLNNDPESENIDRSTGRWSSESTTSPFTVMVHFLTFNITEFVTLS